jgi:hypothetical protein
MTSFVTPAPTTSRTLVAPPTSAITMTELDCILSPLPAICGIPICGDGTVCGGESFQVALTSESIILEPAGCR